MKLHFMKTPTAIGVAVAVGVVGITGWYIFSYRNGNTSLYDDPSWYGYHVHFEVLQFGNINGDRFPDLLTWGYRGRGAGNPSWFAGAGGGFADWKKVHNLMNQGVASGPTYLMDLDGDGDSDIISNTGVWENDGQGGFMDRGFFGFCKATEIRFQSFYVFKSGLQKPQTVDIVRYEPADQVLMIGLERGKWAWDVTTIRNVPDLAVKTENSGRGHLVFWGAVHEAAKDTLNELGISYVEYGDTRLSGVVDARPGRRIFFMDTDQDGEEEVVYWQTETVMNEKGKGGVSRDKCVVAIYKARDGSLNELSSFETGSYPRTREGWRSVLPRKERRFRDFDDDGYVDFLGNDGRIYLQRSDGEFEGTQTPVMVRKNSEIASRYYAVDVNRDGRPDIVSSYMPFENIVFYRDFEGALR